MEKFYAWSTVEQRTIFRRVTIFRHIFLISCHFFICHRNKVLSFIVMNSKNCFTMSFKEMTKICAKTLKTILEICGEIWFLWRNMVLCSMPCIRWSFAEQTRCCMTEDFSENNFLSIYISLLDKQIDDPNNGKCSNYLLTNVETILLR